MSAVTENGFYFYDVPQKFRVSYRVKGTVDIEVEANSREEALAKAYPQASADDFGFELDEVDDVDLDYASECPTRFYLISRAGTQAAATTHPEDGDLPRDPREADDRLVAQLGYTPSWGVREAQGQQEVGL